MAGSAAAGEIVGVGGSDGAVIGKAVRGGEVGGSGEASARGSVGGDGTVGVGALATRVQANAIKIKRMIKTVFLMDRWIVFLTIYLIEAWS